MLDKKYIRIMKNTNNRYFKDVFINNVMGLIEYDGFKLIIERYDNMKSYIKHGESSLIGIIN